MKKQITVPVFIPHQGCPHRCIFCDQNTISGHEKAPSVDTLAPVVSEYTRTAGHPPHIEVAFFGGTFTGLPLNLQQSWLGEARRLKRKGLITHIRLSTRPDFIDASIAAFLKDYTVDTVELGVQSLDSEVLELTERGHSAQDVFEAVDHLKKNTLSFGIQLMPGLPGDSREKSMNSLRKSLELEPDGIRLYPACAFKKTKMGDMALRGDYRPLSLADAADWCAAMTILCNDAGVTVLRTGLHPLNAEGLENLISGPYHSAFGFMVRSLIRRTELEVCLDKYSRGSTVVVEVPALAEEYTGYRRSNIDYFRQQKDISITIRSNSHLKSIRVIDR